MLTVMAAADLIPDAEKPAGDNQQSALASATAGLFRDAAGFVNSDVARELVSSVLQLAQQGENYIVTLRPDFPVQEVLDHVAWLEQRLGSNLNLGHIVHKYHMVPENNADASAASVDAVDGFYGYAGTLHPALVEALRALPIVRTVAKDDIASIEQVQATVLVQQRATWGLARICRVQRPASYYSPLTYTYNARRGLGTDIFVLDTGVRTDHVELAGRVTQPTLPGIPQSSMDPNGHGSHVAGICASTTYGVAKGARIVSLQVLGASGTGPWSNVIKGVEQAVASRRATRRPTVINISIVGTVNAALNQALRAATNAGVVVVVAAGNSGSETCKTSPGSLGGGNSAVIVVGAMGQSDTQSGFSNWGACNDIVAPGEWIDSIGNAGPTAKKQMSGTSMASPHVAGAAAVVLSQAPSWTPAQVKAYLKRVGTRSVSNTRGGTNVALYIPPRVQ